MVYRNTAQALFLKAVLSASLITTGAAHAHCATEDDSENQFADQTENFDSLTLQSSDDVTYALVDYLRGKPSPSPVKSARFHPCSRSP